MMNQLPTFKDTRGALTLAEIGKDIPFEIKRVFWIYDVPTDETRGKHASYRFYEYLVALQGEVDIWLEDQQGRKKYTLNHPDQGLLVPPLTWIELTRFSHNAILLAMASEEYDPDMYINSYEEFIQVIGTHND